MDKKENLNEALSALSMLRRKKQEETSTKTDATKEARIKLFETFSANKTILDVDEVAEHSAPVCEPTSAVSQTEKNETNFSEKENANTTPTADSLNAEKTVDEPVLDVPFCEPTQNFESVESNTAESDEKNVSESTTQIKVVENTVVDTISFENTEFVDEETYLSNDSSNELENAKTSVEEEEDDSDDEIVEKDEEEKDTLEDNDTSEQNTITDENEDRLDYDYPQKNFCQMQDNPSDEYLFGNQNKDETSELADKNEAEENENNFSQDNEEENDDDKPVTFDDSDMSEKSIFDVAEQNDEEDEWEPEAAADTSSVHNSVKNVDISYATSASDEEVVRFLDGDNKSDSRDLEVENTTLNNSETGGELQESNVEKETETSAEADELQEEVEQEETQTDPELYEKFVPMTLIPKNNLPVKNESVEEKDVMFDLSDERHQQVEKDEEESKNEPVLEAATQSQVAFDVTAPLPEKKQAGTTQTISNDEISEAKKFAWWAYILFFIPLLINRKNKFALFHANEGLDIFIIDMLSIAVIISYWAIKTSLIWAEFTLMVLYFGAIGFLILTTLTKLVMIIASIKGKYFQTPWLWKTQIIKK